MKISLNIISLALTSALIAVPSIGIAASFTDIPADSPVGPAAEYLQSKGIVQDAAKFNPDQKLTRAQAAKVLVAPLVPPEELAKITSSTFTDVPSGEWYTSYVEAARKLGLVDTAPKFNPGAPVTKAAFMKMLFSAKRLTYQTSFNDFQSPLSSDVNSPSEWYYPVLRFGLATSMIAAGSDGKLNPAKDVTRGEMALLYYRLEIYQQGRRMQALLSQAEVDISNVVTMLDQKQVEEAEWASARSVIITRGALAAKPEEPIVKGAVKVAEGFRSLVVSYRAGSEGRFDDAIAAAKEAYSSAEKAQAFSAQLTTMGERMKLIAKNMADEARQLKAQGAE